MGPTRNYISLFLKKIKNLYRVLKLLLIIAIFFGLSVYLYGNWGQFTEISWWHRPHFIFAHIFLLCLMFLALIIGWRQALFISGARISFKQSLLNFLIPNSGKYVPGKIIMFAGRIVLCKQMRIGTVTTLEAIIFEHTILIAATFPFFGWSLLNNYFLFTSGACHFAGMVVFLGMLIFVLWPSLLIGAINYLIRYFKGSFILPVPSSTGTILLFCIYLIAWVCYGSSGVVLASAIGLENIPADLVFSGFIIAWLIGFVSFITPGGIGVREVILCVLLNDYANATQVFALAFTARVLWTLVEIFGSAISMFWMDNLGVDRTLIPKNNIID